MAPTECPAQERLERYAACEADEPDVATHVSGCEPCAERVRQFAKNNDLLAEFAAANVDRLDGEPAPAPLPSVPGYDILREIHRGAQGVVFEAVQLATRRRVAVKTLAGGAFATARQRHRFEREVELVAALRHPNVVTLFDSGRAGDGGYYLAMELVEGEQLDEYVRRREAGGGGRRVPRWKLELFAGICAAVNAAHQRGIIHRDLKPANIVVDGDGRPRVLDFGLARRGEEEEGTADELSRTIAGEFLGTFAYASPEQVGGEARDVDIRSDVYALGVILYEILTGGRPYRLVGSMADIVQTILGRDPPPPSTRCPAVDRDLDAITMTALTKEPARRYQSAGALLDDVRHVLAGEPINARRHHRWYVLRKTLARHRVPVTMAALLVLALVAYGASMAVLYAQKKAETARKDVVFDAIMSVLGSEALSTRSGEHTLPVLFEEIGRAVDGLADYPEAEAGARRKLGLAQLERGDRRLALSEFDRALDVYVSLRDAPHADIAESHHNRGRALWALGRFDEAELAYVTALDMRRVVHGERHEDVAMTTSHLAATHRQQGRYDEAERGYRETLALRQEIHGRESEPVAASLNNLGGLLRDVGRYEEAGALYEEALAMIRRLVPDEDKRVARGIHNVATYWLARGDAERAAELLREALALKLERYDDHHTTVASTRHTLAKAVLALGGVDEAETLATAALAARVTELDPAHPDIAASRSLLEEIRVRRAR